jgi:ABC-type branched-subunit amino acid transport system ATPase component
MKVIMLEGPSSCGKTTTVNLVYDILIATLGTTVITAKSLLGGNPKDFEAMLMYAGKKVALFSMGDYSNAVVGAMNKYHGLADVLVVACNSKFTHPRIAITAYPNHIIAKVKQPLANQAIDDNRVANSIVALI